MKKEAPNWEKITSHQTNRGLVAYVTLFEYGSLDDLIGFLQGKTVIDAGSGFNMLAFELALLNSSALVYSVNPQRDNNPYNDRLAEAESRLTGFQQWGLSDGKANAKDLLELIDVTGLSCLAHEIDLAPESAEVIFDVFGPLFYLGKPQWQKYIDATWDKYLELLKPGGVIMVDGIYPETHSGSFRINRLRERGISWENQGEGIKVVKPAA